METTETFASIFGIFPDEVSKPQCMRHPDAHGPFVKLRNILIAGAALALPLVAVALPAGASTPHPKFITAIHRVAPASKHLTNKYLINLGETACHTLGQHPTTPGVVDGDFGPVAEVLGTIQDDNLQYNDGLSDTQISEVLGVSILYLCPSYEPGVKQFDQIEGSGVSDPGGGSEWVWQPASSAPPTTTTVPHSAAYNITAECFTGDSTTWPTCNPPSFQATAQDNAMYAKDIQTDPALSSDSVAFVTAQSLFTCSLLEQGNIPVAVVEGSQDTENIPPVDAATIIVGGVATFCPRYASVVGNG